MKLGFELKTTALIPCQIFNYPKRFKLIEKNKFNLRILILKTIDHLIHTTTISNSTLERTS